MTAEKAAASERVVRWLHDCVVGSARGDELQVLDKRPSGLFWLGRLAPEERVRSSALGDRAERLDPCAVGMVVRPRSGPPWSFTATVRACAWLQADRGWRKTAPIEVRVPVETRGNGTTRVGEGLLADALGEVVGTRGLGLAVEVVVRTERDGTPEMTICLVNTSPQEHGDLADTNLYETSLRVDGMQTEPFLLDALPDSFRYDRRVPAYGVNCGVKPLGPGEFITTDTVQVPKRRPKFWSVKGAIPDLSFARLATDPLPHLRALVDAYEDWGRATWSEKELGRREREEGWSEEMRREANAEAAQHKLELGRLRDGLKRITSNPNLRRSFCLMNKAMRISARGKYDAWRPFQIGFLLANIASIAEPMTESEVVDIVWFPTGGGKTETYLGLLITAAFFDRLRGKTSGVTGWSRFPLRMLSLQQTQRFASAAAGAELVRRREGIQGDPFSIGFFVGQGATPNRLKLDPKDGEPDVTQPETLQRFKVLLRCPFCDAEGLRIGFDRARWVLEHRCPNQDCPWEPPGLPFYIVDEEIYRFLPTIIVGTLDKAALVAFQAAARGLVGPPWGRCSEPGHGFTYSPRKSKPSGCLVPGCKRPRASLDMPDQMFGPSFRLQDELHLLRDSLGAVDAHYEALLDHLQRQTSETTPKILASSATLAGYSRQADVLYQRNARVFPLQGPTADTGFWISDSADLARMYVAVAPRGVTLEYATDRTVEELQRAVRQLVRAPADTCAEIGIDANLAPAMASLFGVDVVYGNTLRDLDAVSRSLETQIDLRGPLNSAALTGRTMFEEVRQALDRLEDPEESFEDRLHVITASSMMSHGVDLDRLNVMVMLGHPLTTAEFIQATSRVGRRWPGLVFVMHKIGRERDAGILRSFGKYVAQGDRFVEAIPITRRSRRVLERTTAGIELARINLIYEPRSARSLVKIADLRRWLEANGISAESEFDVVAEALHLEEPLDEPLRQTLRDWMEMFFNSLRTPAGQARFASHLCPKPPMMSLRDVEEQVPIRGDLD